jgi:hypothetical protein
LIRLFEEYFITLSFSPQKIADDIAITPLADIFGFAFSATADSHY